MFHQDVWKIHAWYHICSCCKPSSYLILKLSGLVLIRRRQSSTCFAARKMKISKLCHWLCACVCLFLTVCVIVCVCVIEWVRTEGHYIIFGLEWYPVLWVFFFRSVTVPFCMPCHLYHFQFWTWCSRWISNSQEI